MQFIIGVLLLVNWLVVGDLHVEPRPIGPKPLHLGHDTDWALFDSMVAAMRIADPDAPVVIITGDFLAHHFPNDEPLARRTMARIVRTFNAAFPRAQFVVVLGNNDDPCGDYRTTPGTPYYAYLAHLWAPLVDRTGAGPDFEQTFGTDGWYRARLPLKGMNVFALNSVYWSPFYRSCTGVFQDTAQRELQWFAQALATMPSVERAIVIMHIPPGDDAVSTMGTHRLFAVPFLHQRTAALLVNQLRTFSARVPFAIAGHTHRSDFRLFGNVAMLIAPSISPAYYNNPTFVLLDVGREGTLRDYTPFYYDFGSRTWHRGDSFDRTYGVNSFTPDTLARIHTRLGNEELLRARWAQMAVSHSGYPDVNSRTWRVHWCAQTELAESFSDCSGVRRRVQIVVISCMLAGAAIVGPLAILAVRRRRRRRPS